MTPAGAAIDPPEAGNGTPPAAGAGRRIPLTQLKRGQRAVVDCSTLTHLPEQDRCLLRAMGMYDRCTVKVCRPGTPCIVEVDSTRLGLSGSVARRILVEPCDEPH